MIVIFLYKEVREGGIMRTDMIIGIIFAAIGIIAALLKHQSSVDLDETEDLKELHSVNDLFMVH